VVVNPNGSERIPVLVDLLPAWKCEGKTVEERNLAMCENTTILFESS